MRKLVVGAALIGCSSHGAPTTPKTPAPAGVTTRCYAGSGTTTLVATERVVDRFDAVARRTTDPAASRIQEEMVVGGSRPNRYRVEMIVTGAKLAMKEAGGAFEGDGELVGPPWQWTSWTTRSRMPGGLEVTSTDRIEGDAIIAEKSVVKDGAPLVRIVEKLAAMPCAEFDARAGQIAPQQQ